MKTLEICVWKSQPENNKNLKKLCVSDKYYNNENLHSENRVKTLKFRFSYLKNFSFEIWTWKQDKKPLKTDLKTWSKILKYAESQSGTKRLKYVSWKHWNQDQKL